MLRSIVFVWLFALFSAVAFAQNGPPASICNDNPDLPGCGSSSTTSKTSSTKTQDAATTGTNTGTAGAASTGGGGGGGGGQTASDVSATSRVVSLAATQTGNTQSNPTVGASQQGSDNGQSSSGGMSNSSKIGIGVGVGVGGALIIGALAMFFILRRRKRNSRYGSANASAAHLRDQPAMSSAAPALAGVSAMGQSPSKGSLPQTPSQHSLADIPAPVENTRAASPPRPTIQPPSSHSLARAPSQHSAAPPTPEQENLMPAPPPYQDVFDAPSPMEERAGDVSPVSPISPINR